MTITRVSLLGRSRYLSIAMWCRLGLRCRERTCRRAGQSLIGQPFSSSSGTPVGGEVWAAPLVVDGHDDEPVVDGAVPDRVREAGSPHSSLHDRAGFVVQRGRPLLGH